MQGGARRFGTKRRDAVDLGHGQHVGVAPLLGRSTEHYGRTPRGCRYRCDPELRTLQAIARHRSANQAAAELFVTAGTVKKHLASVYRKLWVNGRDEAILQAGRMGILR